MIATIQLIDTTPKSCRVELSFDPPLDRRIPLTPAALGAIEIVNMLGGKRVPGSGIEITSHRETAKGGKP